MNINKKGLIAFGILTLVVATAFILFFIFFNPEQSAKRKLIGGITHKDPDKRKAAINYILSNNDIENSPLVLSIITEKPFPYSPEKQLDLVEVLCQLKLGGSHWFSDLFNGESDLKKQHLLNLLIERANRCNLIYPEALETFETALFSKSNDTRTQGTILSSIPQIAPKSEKGKSLISKYVNDTNDPISLIHAYRAITFYPSEISEKDFIEDVDILWKKSHENLEIMETVLHISIYSFKPFIARSFNYIAENIDSLGNAYINVLFVDLFKNNDFSFLYFLSWIINDTTTKNIQKSRLLELVVNWEIPIPNFDLESTSFKDFIEAVKSNQPINKKFLSSIDLLIRDKLDIPDSKQLFQQINK